MSVRSYKIDSGLKRVALVVAGIIALFVLIVGFGWLFGNTISTQAQTKEVAEFAVGIAPADPQPHFALAVLNERSFMPEDLPKSLDEYEKAAALSPYDYRLWLALGKARERNGDIGGAESALRRAISLAPNYGQAQWAYGNVLLRQGKNSEAFQEIRKAVDNDPKFANPAATTAWQIFDGNVDEIRKTIGSSAPVNSALASFLVREKKLDSALEIWKSLPDERVKTDLKPDSERIAAAFLSVKRYKKYLEINSRIDGGDGKEFKFETVTNGGFELNVKNEKAKAFEWNIGRGVQPQISVATNERKSGLRSLYLNFKATKRTDFRTISQTVAVDGGKNYRFDFAYKSELDTADSMKWEIVDSIDGKLILGETEPISQSSGWNVSGVDFEVPEKSEGVLIRLVRVGCDSAVCPISGKVYFDDIGIR